MDKFKALEEQKQDKIRSGALKAFARHGYKKTAMSEVAKEAGISKSMVFYYFSSKYELYEYLVNYCMHHILNKFDNVEIKTTDYFDYIKESAVVKMEALAKYPSMMKFITTFYFETDTEIEKLKFDYLSVANEKRKQMIGPNLDYSKFKDNIDPDLLLNMLTTWSEGYISKAEQQLITMDETQMDSYYQKMVAEFIACLDMFKNNFYKEEYL